ncbi:tumor necrosis factor receptor superfamily member 14-like isoform X2 [Brachyistius frenatus]|uniref:tumor necrosis factor receptor superfamily member 14-like isoform X2 n=1 Tax=Brachyistius frenatus TaxID=100188 RepID=UPI0037E98548
MIWRRKHLTAATFLILVMKVFSGLTITCHPAKYLIGDECCPKCLPGSRVKTHCTEFRSTSCLPCIEGTYMDKPNGLSLCALCTICDAGSGLKVKRSCTVTSDTACEPLEGFYCTDSTEGNCAAAEKHTTCQPGQYISQKGTAFRDSVCSDCTDGTFSDGTFTSCQQHTQCETINLQLIKEGTTSTDAECGEPSSNVAVIVISILVVFLLIVSFLFIIYFLKRKTTCLKGKNFEQGNAATHSREATVAAESLKMLPV